MSKQRAYVNCQSCYDTSKIIDDDNITPINAHFHFYRQYYQNEAMRALEKVIENTKNKREAKTVMEILSGCQICWGAEPSIVNHYEPVFKIIKRPGKVREEEEREGR